MTKKAALFDDDRAGAIYRTAAQMIYEKGFDATSMNEIAEAVQLTKPGLYYYVKGKKELLFSIMNFAMDLLDSEVVAVAKQHADALDCLRTLVRRHAWLLTQATGAIAILIDETRGLSDDQRVRITARKRSYFDFIRQTLERLKSEGRLRAVDTTTATFSLLGQVMWLARWYQDDGRLDRDQVVDGVVEVALGGVLTDEARAAGPAAEAELEAVPVAVPA